MRRAIVIFLALFLLISEAQAFWIWTPKSKKWVNPKWSAKNSPQEQYKFAKEIFDSGDYKTALIEFRKLIKHFPESREAADGQFYMGSSLEKMDKLYDAYLAYQKVINKYPFSDKMEAVLEKEFEIANSLSEKKEEVLGILIPQQYYAIEIYKKIIENSPYHKLAALSQYKIGLVLKSLARFDEAKQEFEKVVSTYPESEWFEPAKYQAAQCASLGSLKSDYDQALSKEAKEKFQEFAEKHPDAELSKEAHDQIEILTDKEAQKDYNIAQFYEKQKEFKSAQIYYEDIMRKYPKSSWAYKSLEKMQILEKENKL